MVSEKPDDGWVCSYAVGRLVAAFKRNATLGGLVACLLLTAFCGVD
ncbi:MAG: hypothetical protein NTV00_10710 [Methylococcales bacterium]|nr:hypothetical protein [Methylococcales bacterium]